MSDDLSFRSHRWSDVVDVSCVRANGFCDRANGFPVFDAGLAVRAGPISLGLRDRRRGGIGNRTADVDASFTNISTICTLPPMGLVEARRENLVVLADAFIQIFEGSVRLQDRCFPAYDPSKDCSSSLPEAGYRVLDDGSSIDALGGIRSGT